MGCHIGRHRAHEQRVNLGVRFERLSPVGEEAQQPGIKPFVGGNIDAGAAARDNEGENMQFLLALSKPALYQQSEIQLIGKDKMFQLLLGEKKTAGLRTTPPSCPGKKLGRPSATVKAARP